MKHRQFAIRLMCIVAFLVAGMAGSSGLTAAQQVYTAPGSGAIIDAGGTWLVEQESTESGDGYDVVSLYREFDSVLISFLPSGTDLVMARDLVLGDFGDGFENSTVIDRGAYGNVSYSLDMVSAEGGELGIFTLFLGERTSGFVEVYMYLAPIRIFESGFGDAQREISVNDANIFDGVDGSGLQDLLDANAGTTGGSTDLPDENIVTDEPAEPVEDGTADDANAGPNYVTTVQDEVDTLFVSVNAFLVAFTDFAGGDLTDAELDDAVQQMQGIAFGWSEYPVVAEGIVAPAGFAEIDVSYQALAGDVGTLGDSWFTFIDTGTEAAFDDVFTNLETVTNGLGSLQTLLEDASNDASGDVATTATEEPVEDPTEVPTEVAAEDGGSGVGTSHQLPDRDEDPEIEEEIQNESETGRGGQGVDLSDYEEFGLVSDTEYVSPQHDVDIVWNDNWYFDESTDTPISSDTDTGMDSVSITWMGDSYVITYVDILESDGFTPEEYVEYWMSDEYMTTVADPNAEILLDDSTETGGAVLYRDYLDDGTEISMLIEVKCLDRRCDLIAYTTMIGTPESFGDAYTDAGDGIEIDGEALLSSFSTRQIERAID